MADELIELIRYSLHMNKKAVAGFFLALTLVVTTVCCLNDPVSTQPTNNAHVPVSLLFEHDGCKVFRFTDGQYARYFALGTCGDASVSHVESCGKNCSRPVEVPSVNK